MINKIKCVGAGVLLLLNAFILGTYFFQDGIETYRWAVTSAVMLMFAVFFVEYLDKWKK